MNRTIYHEIADNYRDKTGRAGGVVVIYYQTVSGWVDQLRNPEHWRPGCIAVLDNGALFQSLGGDHHNGATRWEQMSIAEQAA